MQPLPESLSPIRAYVDRARELKSVSAVVSHQLRRARKLDRPDTAPTPRDRWAVLEAPRIAQGLHASAVLLDALTQHGPLSATELAVLRAAHQRSQATGRTFYVDYVNKVTSWDRPGGEESGESRVDRATGKTYYVDYVNKAEERMQRDLKAAAAEAAKQQMVADSLRKAREQGLVVTPPAGKPGGGGAAPS
ncbi:hypothetical protein EMIHUDRAFT_221899 [Emiliania huxleyi CCMP1516]|uniref:WW domain-containing protein n=2 Tax=Emiliania huxleyi TaxID=2903 RepID=A0A0D3HXK7_EMIH1|nr:hypothetical protein EMIHUDRAFT_221899 [Emiliania huxleyi CCMP1516]EOD03742.1 hypothetical protein EMIHUDRAFT_221899 [Emiliania huxleyi CCMP1516]|eukprot:XP_005756171.1 hypothetical protein EMIHUDRAFT_221899 [Emiliania huxleyi CCMP1516]